MSCKGHSWVNLAALCVCTLLYGCGFGRFSQEEAARIREAKAVYLEVTRFSDVPREALEAVEGETAYVLREYWGVKCFRESMGQSFADVYVAISVSDARRTWVEGPDENGSDMWPAGGSMWGEICVTLRRAILGDWVYFDATRKADPLRFTSTTPYEWEDLLSEPGSMLPVLMEITGDIYGKEVVGRALEDGRPHVKRAAEIALRKLESRERK